jgi:hypothetical protein
MSKGRQYKIDEALNISFDIDDQEEHFGKKFTEKLGTITDVYERIRDNKSC